MNDQKLKDMIESTYYLTKQRYAIAKDEIEYIIKNNIKDEKQIERQLDEMLDILFVYETNETLLTFRRLCRHYFDINPQATADYINFYKEQNDPEGTKFGNKAVEEEER